MNLGAISHATELQDRADLIIAVTDRQLAREPNTSTKVVTDEELFGVSIPNPYPDNEDEESLEKYREVCAGMERVIEEHFDEILDRAGAVPRL
jgi:protein-tyrosine-phosphatase